MKYSSPHKKHPKADVNFEAFKFCTKIQCWEHKIMRPTVWRLNGKKDPAQTQAHMAFLHAHMFVTCLIKCRLVVTVPAHWPWQAPAKIEQGPGWPFCWPYRNVRNVDFFRYVNVHRKTNSRKPQDKLITAFLPNKSFIFNLKYHCEFMFFLKINLIFYFIIVYYSIFRGTKNRGGPWTLSKAGLYGLGSMFCTFPKRPNKLVMSIFFVSCEEKDFYHVMLVWWGQLGFDCHLCCECSHHTCMQGGLSPPVGGEMNKMLCNDN